MRDTDGKGRCPVCNGQDIRIVRSDRTNGKVTYTLYHCNICDHNFTVRMMKE